MHVRDDLALRLAWFGNHRPVMERLLVAGASVQRVRFSDLGSLPTLRLIQCVVPRRFPSLAESIQALWMRVHLRVRVRLARVLQRARDRLDRPPTARLGAEPPNRDRLIAHLRTAGRRFARDYWTDGMSLFFPSLQPVLGPLPGEFAPPHLSGHVRWPEYTDFLCVKDLHGLQVLLDWNDADTVQRTFHPQISTEDARRRRTLLMPCPDVTSDDERVWRALSPYMDRSRVGGSPHDIAQRVNMPVDDVRAILDFLDDYGFVHLTFDGLYERGYRDIPAGVTSAAQR